MARASLQVGRSTRRRIVAEPCRPCALHRLDEPRGLAAGSLLWGLGFYFVGPYQIGLAAALDRRGRVAVAATALINLGYGVGPALGGRLRQLQIDRGLDASVLVAVIAGATLLSLLLMLPVAIAVDRARSGARE